MELSILSDPCFRIGYFEFIPFARFYGRRYGHGIITDVRDVGETGNLSSPR